MTKTVLVVLAMVLLPAALFAVDGIVLINQSTVIAAGGFPYRITQPGSYRLSGNLNVDEQTTAIVIAHDNVTLDLNGFTIGGPNVCRSTVGPPIGLVMCTFTSTGIGIDAGFSANITIANGVIVGMGRYGIVSGPGTRVDSVTVSQSGSDGISIASGLINTCRLLFNGGNGILANSSAGSVKNSLFEHNKGLGMLLNVAWGYSGNVFVENNLGNNFLVQVSGGLNQGQNLCQDSACKNAVF